MKEKIILLAAVCLACGTGCDMENSGGAGGRGEKGIGGESGNSPAARVDRGTPGSGSNQYTRGANNSEIKRTNAQTPEAIRNQSPSAPR